MSTFAHHGRDIFYQVDGDLTSGKEIIVLLNGIMMSTASWDGFVKAFSETTTLIRFDMLDQGQSARMDEPYDQSLQVDVLIALLDHLAVSSCHLVGISYGASVALQAAIRFPKRVAKLVLANAVAATSPWLKAIGDGWNQVAKTRDGEAYYNISIPYIYSDTFYNQNIAWMEARKEMLVPLFSDPEFLDRMTRLTVSAETHDTRDQLQDIAMPTLLIAGEKDVLTPRSEQEFLHHQIPDSTLLVFPGCGHASMYEQPKAFTSSILGFVHANHIPTII